jgi:DNA-directed RNA polymerase subunit M/transcription elongation factor TFIIS
LRRKYCGQKEEASREISSIHKYEKNHPKKEEVYKRQTKKMKIKILLQRQNFK